MKAKKAAEAPRPVRAFNMWTCLVCEDIKPADRILLGMIVADWCEYHRPLVYRMKYLKDELGMTWHTIHSTLDRLKESGWLEYVSRKGQENAGLTVTLTQTTLKRFELPWPHPHFLVGTKAYERTLIPVDDSDIALAKSEEAVSKCQLHSRHYITIPPRDSLKKSDDGNLKRGLPDEPVFEVHALVKCWDEYMKAMQQHDPRNYTEQDKIEDAEMLIELHPLTDWKSCIDWIRGVKKHLIHDDFAFRIILVRMRILKTVWNFFVEARAQGRTSEKELVASEYDKRTRKEV